MVFVIIVVVVLFFIILGIFLPEDNSQNDDSYQDYSTEPFRISVVKQFDKDEDGEAYPVFMVKGKGAITAPRDGFPYKFVLHIYDETDPNKTKVVLSGHEALQAHDSAVFCYESAEEVLPYSSSIMQEWVQIVRIPCELITCAVRGQRKLVFVLDIINARRPPNYEYGFVNDQDFRTGVIAQAHSEKMFNNTEVGYEEFEKVRAQTDELTILLAMYISGADGEFDAEEAEIIKDWVKRRVSTNSENSSENEKLKGDLNKYIKDSYEKVSNGTADIDNACEQILNNVSIGERYDILDLCLRVAKADGKADPEEMKAIEELSHKMKLNMTRVRSMQEAILPVAIHVEQAPGEKLLGIEEGMSKEQIKKILNTEFRKWNSRVTHSDEEKRTQAENMMQLIGELRNKYLGGD